MTQKMKKWSKSFLKILPMVGLFALGSWAAGKMDKKTLEPLTPHPGMVSLEQSFAQVADRVKPAVVNISAVQFKKANQDFGQFFFGDPNEFFFPQNQRRKPKTFRAEGTGSGVIIDADGTILTNNHVIQDANQLIVTLLDGKEYKGKVVGTDERSDLAIIRIKGRGDFPYVPLGDSNEANIGKWVMAVGSPFGLEQTVTVGIVSAVRQSLQIEGKTFRDLIQTDAAINRGNSGGPLVNMKGELVGINTAIYAPTGVFSGIGFAIPSNHAKPIVTQLVSKGFVERSWMGVEILPVDHVMAQQFGLDEPRGVLINHVVKESPAEKAGLERGDVVLKFNKEKITSVSQLQNIVANTPPRSVAKVKILREGRKKVVKLTTSILPSQLSARVPNDSSGDGDLAPDTAEWLGATVANATDNTKGVRVLDIPVDSDAAEVGLKEGDIILKVNQKAIKGVDDLKSVDKESDESLLKEGLLVDVRRLGRPYYLSYKAPV